MSTNLRLQNYDTSESKLRREFEMYGPIKKIIMVQDVDTAKPKGYAFIEYEHERDMHGKRCERVSLKKEFTVASTEQRKLEGE